MRAQPTKFRVASILIAGLTLAGFVAVYARQNTEPLQDQLQPDLTVALYYFASDTNSATDRLENELGFNSDYRFPRLGGFAAKLSPVQQERLRKDKAVYEVLHGESMTFIYTNQKRQDAAKQTKDLEKKLKFRAEYSYSQSFKGFGAKLSGPQLEQVDKISDIGLLRPETFTYIIDYNDEVGFEDKTNNLQKDLKLKITNRFPPGSISAKITQKQLSQIDSDPQIKRIYSDGFSKIAPAPNSDSL